MQLAASTENAYRCSEAAGANSLHAVQVSGRIVRSGARTQRWSKFLSCIEDALCGTVWCELIAALEMGRYPVLSVPTAVPRFLSPCTALQSEGQEGAPALTATASQAPYFASRGRLRDPHSEHATVAAAHASCAYLAAWPCVQWPLQELQLCALSIVSEKQ